MPYNFNFKHGKVTFNDFIFDEAKSLAAQINNLKEDMLQVEYKDNYLLDIGWYPSFDIEGSFQVRVIENYNWEKPIYLAKAKDICQLKKEIELAMLVLQH